MRLRMTGATLAVLLAGGCGGGAELPPLEQPELGYVVNRSDTAAYIASCIHDQDSNGSPVVRLAESRELFAARTGLGTRAQLTGDGATSVINGHRWDCGGAYQLNAKQTLNVLSNTVVLTPSLEPAQEPAPPAPTS